MAQIIKTKEEKDNRQYPSYAVHFKLDAEKWMKPPATYDYPKAACGTPHAGYLTTDPELVTCRRCRQNAGLTPPSNRLPRVRFDYMR